MIVGTALLATLAFAFSLRLTGVVGAAASATDTARSALAAVRDPSLDDDARERAARDASGALFKATGSILVRGLVSAVLLFLPVWLADLTGLARSADVVAFLTSWQGIALALVTGTAAVLPGRRA
ncbi:MAG: hypothetical protein AB7O28_03755 [Vicinamibacterales bacterium]